MEVYNIQPDHAGLQTKLDFADLQPVQTYGQPQYLPQDAAYEHQQQHQQQQQQQQQQYQGYGAPQSTRVICGLRRTTFWLVLLLVLVLVLAIVGGTVGGIVGSQKASTSTVTTTTMSVSSSPPSITASLSVLQSVSGTNAATSQQITATHTGTASQPSPSSSDLRGGCPSPSDSQWTSESGYNTFQIYCATDFPVNDMINGEWVPISNFDACLEFCASLNDKRNFTLCYGVAFSYENQPNGACFLKNPAIDVVKDQVSNKLVDSGILIST